MEKRLILAIALSILIIVTFQYLFVKPAAQTPQKQLVREVPPTSIPQADLEQKISSEQDLLSGEEEHVVETDKYIVTFSNIGGSIKKIGLKDYRDTVSGEPLCLVGIKKPKEYIFAINDPLTRTPLDSSIYKLEKKDGMLAYSLKADGVEVIKKYIFHKSDYSIELQLIVKNISDKEKDFTYRIITGSGMSEQSAQDRRFVEVISNVNGKILGFKRPKDNKIINPGIVTWTALKNKYFSIIAKPLVQTKGQFYSENKDGMLITGIEPLNLALPPSSFIENKFVLYVGPSKISDLKKLGLEETVNYGVFGWISKALLALTGFFYSIFRNWGISIIFLSIFLNIILFPLSAKSFKSMQKMQELHPQMEKLKAQHKDNPQKLNKEIMELYKKYKINPFSGCLPLILQMPIFIALYQALMKSVDLRSANFLWIRDLSMPDAVKIPFSLPIIGNSLNILPIVMIIAMVIQQKISTKSMGGAVTEEQKQQQQMMLIIMPIMFGFIFYNMPSGLVLYWVVNTILTIGEQYIIFKKA